jgi:hypothetical protein
MIPNTLAPHDTLVAIRRDDRKSLDDLFGYSTGDVESVREVEAQDSPLYLVLHEFESYLETEKGLIHYPYSTNLVLTPNEINQFLQVSINYQDHEDYFGHVGTFVSALLRTSYVGGNNDFYLNIKNVNPIYNLCSEITANKNRPLKIRMDGDLDSDFGSDSNNLDVFLNGNADSGFLSNSKYSKAFINGNLGLAALYCSEDISIFVKGNVGEEFALDSKGAKALIKGNVGCKFGFSSNELKAYIKGNVSYKFGYGSNHLCAIVKGNVTTNFAKYASDSVILQGKNIGNDPKYPQLIKKLMEAYRQ